ncbi:MAG: hypothetical protein WCN81_06555 [Actinomycetes bacterium]
MKRLAIGLCFFLAGVLLCAINWLGAAAATPALTEWNGTRMDGAWQLVGHGPLILGIILLVASVVLVASAFYEAGEVHAPSSEPARVQQAQPPDAK